jgi:hypothetical protein
MCVKGLADIHSELHELALICHSRSDPNFLQKDEVFPEKFYTSQSTTSNNLSRSRWRVRLGDTFTSTLGNIQSFISSSCFLFTFNFAFSNLPGSHHKLLLSFHFYRYHSNHPDLHLQLMRPLIHPIQPRSRYPRPRHV